MYASVTKMVIGEYMVVEYLDSKTIKIVLLLNENPEGVNIRSIAEELSMSHTTVYNALITLFKLGLAMERRERGRRIIVLTDRGRGVAELLLKIDELLRH